MAHHSPMAKLVQAAFPILQPGDSVPLKTSYTFGMSEWGDTQPPDTCGPRPNRPSHRQTEPLRSAPLRTAPFVPRCTLLCPADPAFGIAEIFWPLLYGGTLVVVSPRTIRDPVGNFTLVACSKALSR